MGLVTVTDIAQVWLAGRHLVGPAARQRLRDGGTLVFELTMQVRNSLDDPLRRFSFQLQAYPEPHHVALYGRLDPDGEWCPIAGPWLEGMALPDSGPGS